MLWLSARSLGWRGHLQRWCQGRCVLLGSIVADCLEVLVDSTGHHCCHCSNGLQERIFSACTWFDNPLRQRLQNKRFEMSVILVVNESLLKCKVPSDDEAKQIVERVIAKFDNSIDFGAELALGLDPDAEDFVSNE